MSPQWYVSIVIPISEMRKLKCTKNMAQSPIEIYFSFTHLGLSYAHRFYLSLIPGTLRYAIDFVLLYETKSTSITPSLQERPLVGHLGGSVS